MESENENGSRPGLFIHVADFFTLGAARLIVGAMYVLPYSIGIRIAKACIFVLRLALRRSDRVGMRNLELVFPDKTPAERRAILDRSYLMLARNLQSYAKLPNLTREKAEGMIDYSAGKALIDGVRARHKETGVLLLTLHFGSFELLVQFQALLERPIWFLARGFGLPRLDAWWNVRREMFGNKVFMRKGGYQEIVRRLNEGHEVALLFDQNVKKNHAVYVDFFGIKTATTKTIGLVALRTGAPIIFATNVDHGNGRYDLVAREVKNPIDEPGTTEEKIERVTRRLHEHVEDVIRKHPEQWFWIHRRFKTRPREDTRNFYENI